MDARAPFKGEGQAVTVNCCARAIEEEPLIPLVLASTAEAHLGKRGSYLYVECGGAYPC